MNDHRRILIVDDNPAIHDDFRKILLVDDSPTDNALAALEDVLFTEKEGASRFSNSPLPKIEYRIDSAFKGGDALPMVEAAAKEGRPYSMAFVDVRMPPGLDGILTVSGIWKHYPHTEVVICTAYTDYSWDGVIQILGPSDHLLFLKKPFEPVEVQQMALALTTKWLWGEQVRSNIAQLEKMVAKKTELLVGASKMSALGEMAAGVAHEINNPLATIYMESEDLRKEALKSDSIDSKIVVEAMNHIEATAMRVTRIIRGLQTYARDGSRDRFESASIGSILTDTLALCSERFKNNGVKLSVGTLSEKLTMVCRPTQISEVLLNLLNNAYDAIHLLPEKWISIDVKEHSDGIELSVTDSGSGVAQEIRQKIFDPFFTTKDVGEGTGLGLSISMGIIKSHKGTIDLDTNCENTRFVIHLPKQQE